MKRKTTAFLAPCSRDRYLHFPCWRSMTFLRTTFRATFAHLYPRTPDFIPTFLISEILRTRQEIIEAISDLTVNKGPTAHSSANNI